MPGGITIEQAVDLGYATLMAFDQDDLEMTLKHQTYEIVNRHLAKDRRVYDGGDVVKSWISLKDTGNAKHVRMYETDTPNVANVDKEVTTNWVHAKTSFTYSRKELSMNLGNRTRIYNLLKQRRLNAFREMADMLEEAGWATPASGDDDLAPYGIPGWICQADADSGTGDFVGYHGDYTTSGDSESAFDGTRVGGIACDTGVNTRWANYYADHNDNIDDTFLKLLRRAFRKTKFQAPMIARQAVDPHSDFSNFRFYSNDLVIGELEELAFKSDDKIGADLGKYAGGVIFKGIPLKYVDQLDTELTYVYGGNPFFGVNHNRFGATVLRGEDFTISKPMNKVGQNLVFTVYCDLTYAYTCDNRRTAGFLISDWEGAN